MNRSSFLILLVFVGIVVSCLAASTGGEGCTEIRTIQQWKDLLRSKRAFLLEVYSPSCGSCKEFAETWSAYATEISNPNAAKRLACASINIDDGTQGFQLASASGATEDGIPNVRLFGGPLDGDSVSLMASDPVGIDELRAVVEKATKGLPTDRFNFYLKRGRRDELKRGGHDEL